MFLPARNSIQQAVGMKFSVGEWSKILKRKCHEPYLPHIKKGRPLSDADWLQNEVCQLCKHWAGEW